MRSEPPRATPVTRLLAWADLTPAEFLRVLPAGLMLAFFGFWGMVVVLARLGAGPTMTAFLPPIAGTAGLVAGIRLASSIARRSATLVGSAVMPSGNTTPSRADYSREDALLMQRDVAGALASYEAKLAADPLLVDARIRAADLYARDGKNPRRAEALFREVQRIPNVSARDDVYAANRLVDLYTGELGEPGRALVELRRLIDRYPGSRAADEARRGLAALKARVHQP